MLTRRDFIRTSVVVGAAAGLPQIVGCAPPAPGAPSNAAFPHGVASGDPGADSVRLWTRHRPPSGDATTLTWSVASDATFGDVVATGTAVVSPERDWTTTVLVDGLVSSTSYYFRFSAGTSDSLVTSPIGRTRTAPSGASEHLRFAVVSCSNYGYGYFHNYRAIAERADLDAVIHLGDYIYEYASEGYGETYGTLRELDPPHEIVTLDDYRRRYACYRLDPDLQELHRQHPVIHVWDDHEFADDPFVGGAANHQPAQDGPWEERVAAALQAYGEWMPTNLDGNRIFRTLDYGGLARIVLVDRQRRYIWPEPDDADHYLGREQADWLDDTLEASSARWLLLGAPTTFGATDPDLVSGGWGVGERARVRDALAAGGTDNLVVVTGDIHRATAIDLVEGPGAGSFGVEFGCGSISSPGSDGDGAAPQVRWTSGSSRTYLVLDLTPARVQADVFGFPDLLKYLPFRPQEQHLAAFTCADSAGHLVQAWSPAPTAAAAPLAPAASSSTSGS